MSFDGHKLFNLLPALYRLRDAQLAQTLNLNRGPLESLMMLVAEQLAVVENDLDQLYDDQFIETCADWVIPYIGDLVGYQSLHGVATSQASSRAQVADTITFRRRKGSVALMEQLARDVTGWGAHAVEFFKLLACTQSINHIRPHNSYAPDLRRWQVREYMDTAFDATAHKVDVRRISIQRGRYNLQNLGIFLWSLKPYRLTRSPAAPSPGSFQCFRFNPLGTDLPLFNNPVSQGANISSPALPANVPDRLRRRVLGLDLQSGAGSVYYGEGNSLAIYVDGRLLAPYEIQVCDLNGEEGRWTNVPPQDSLYQAAIDPQLGRIALSPDLAGASPPPRVETSFYYGFNADMGGGEYVRGIGPGGFVVTDPNSVLPFPDTASPPRYSDLQGAVNCAARFLSSNGGAAVEFTQTQTCTQTGDQGLTVVLPPGTTLELRARNSTRTTLLIDGPITVTGGTGSCFSLNGLVIATPNGAWTPASPPLPGLLQIPSESNGGTANGLSQLSLAHCTLVPGWPVHSRNEPFFSVPPVLKAEVPGLQVTVKKSILGGVRMGPSVTFDACDSIIDAACRTNVAYSALDGFTGGGPMSLAGCTVIGKVHSALVTVVSNSIFWAELSEADLSGSPPGNWIAPLWVDRKQDGAVRFSYLPVNAVAPGQYQTIEEGPNSPQPLFVSLRYGDPGYGKLLASTPDAVRRGAEDGGEMGAFHSVMAPLRETDLRTRMQEYLPAGLEFGILYET